MPQSSQLAEPLWTDPDQKSRISVHELIATKKNQTNKRERAQAGNEWSKILHKSSQAKKEPRPPFGQQERIWYKFILTDTRSAKWCEF